MAAAQTLHLEITLNGQPGNGPDDNGTDAVWVSALTGEGMERLEERIPELLSPGRTDGDLLVTRRRQRDELASCVERLEAARRASTTSRS